MSAENKFLKARANLLIEQPFFGTLALRLKIVETDRVDTAATDGKHLFYNAKFVDKLTSHETMGLVAHEVMHCVLQHMTRRQERNPTVWNVAGDLKINGHLLDSGFILPEGGLVDKEHKYDEDSTEAVYAKLISEYTTPDGIIVDGDIVDGAIVDGIPTPTWGLVEDAGKNDVENVSGAQLESDWQVAVNQAAELAKAQGKLPGDIERIIGEVLQPLVDWRQVLWPFFTNTVRDEYTWRKPHRAYIGEDEYLPAMYNESCGTIAICVDISGSVSNAELQQFWSEIVAVAKETQPSKIICIGCDDIVQNVFEWEDLTALLEEPPEFTGGGGTKFSPCFEKLDELDEDIEACVYLTDLGSDDFGDEPYYPVLWVSTDKHERAPWGETIYMEIN